jgi:hypothetical protein
VTDPLADLRAAKERADTAHAAAIEARRKLQAAVEDHRNARQELLRLVLEARAARISQREIAKALRVTPQRVLAMERRAGR